MKKGQLITFSGIDSAGKTTYIDLLVKEMKEKGMKHKVVWSRGGYTSGCELAKKIARKILGKKLPEPGISEKRTKLLKDKNVSRLWYIMAVLDLIRLYGITFRFYKLLGYTIIADRYFFYTLIDFLFMYEEDFLYKSILWKILLKVYCRPNYSVLLYISPETSLKRSEQKKELYSETLTRRIERINRYISLKNKGVWEICVNTETAGIDICWQTIKDKINRR